jgi:uncharacterized protein YqhQ
MADKNSIASPEDILVGGQAVIEGVMMRTPHAYAVAVRRADGSIEVKRDPVKRLSDYCKPLSWVVIRGFAVLIQSMVLGIRTFNYSINVAMADLESQEEGKTRKPKTEGTVLPVIISLVLGVSAAVLLFILFPLWITSWLRGYVPAIHNWIVFNLVDGLIRVIFFLAYILLISLLKDIRRVFQYHGAEHKTVHTWEAAEELTVENVRGKSTLHPRCGTSFLLFVMVVSIIVFSIFKFSSLWAIFLSRLVLIPLVSGLAYELIRFSAPRSQKGFFRLMVLPGLTLQRITTKEPSNDQLEIAIRALKEALELEGIKAREAQTAA